MDLMALELPTWIFVIQAGLVVTAGVCERIIWPSAHHNESATFV